MFWNTRGSFTVVLYYRRDKATVEQMQALVQAAQDRAVAAARAGKPIPDDVNLTGGAARVLLPGEEKNPWPAWLRDLLESRGYEPETFNYIYLKKGLTQRRLERESRWVDRITAICKAKNGLHKFWLCLTVSLSYWLKLYRITDEMRLQFARIEPSTIDGYTEAYQPALDTLDPNSGVRGTPSI